VKGDGVKRDLQRAAELLRQSAESGNARAQYDLGTLYAKGQGVPLDMQKAASWTARAAEAGLADAQLDYAVMLIQGRGTEKDYNKGLAMLKASAENGNPVAQNRLARVLAYGVEVKPEPVQAAKWHLLARQNGISDLRLDIWMGGLGKEQRARAEAAAREFQGSVTRELR